MVGLMPRLMHGLMHFKARLSRLDRRGKLIDQDILAKIKAIPIVERPNHQVDAINSHPPNNKPTSKTNKQTITIAAAA